VVEFLGGLITLAAFLRFGVSTPLAISHFLFATLFYLNLLVLAVIDFRYYVVPVEWVAGSVLVFFLWSLWLDPQSLKLLLLGGLIGTGFLGIQFLISRGRWMGGGDPWVGALLGFALGLKQLIIIFYFTYLLGGLLAALLLLSKRAKRGARIAFVPLLALGAYGALWLAPYALEWWEKLFV
jgi:prepilin signal peptidase PulO-like enzyme (type II secretory pathway)